MFFPLQARTCVATNYSKYKYIRSGRGVMPSKVRVVLVNNRLDLNVVEQVVLVKY